MPKMLLWGIKMSSENSSCLDNIDQDQVKVKQREGRSLSILAAEAAVSQLACALDQEGGTIGEQKFFHESLPLLIASMLSSKGGKKSKGMVVVLTPYRRPMLFCQQ